MKKSIKKVNYVRISKENNKYNPVARAYDFYCNTNKITDSDLTEAIPILQDTERVLNALGPRFDFSARELRLMLMALRQAQNYRNTFRSS